MRRLTYSMMLALVESRLAGGERATCIIDVRSKDEVQATGMIPTSVNIPLDQLEATLKKTSDEIQREYNIPKPGPTDRVVTYCLKGMRAESAAAILQASGYTNVDTYPGSWAEWEANYNK